MSLQRDRLKRVAGRDTDYACAWLPQMRIRRSASIECSQQIDVDNCFEPVRRHSVYGRRKISRSSADQDVDFTELIAGRLERSFYCCKIADINGMCRGSTAGRLNRRRGRIQFLLFAADQ